MNLNSFYYFLPQNIAAENDFYHTVHLSYDEIQGFRLLLVDTQRLQCFVIPAQAGIHLEHRGRPLLPQGWTGGAKESTRNKFTSSEADEIDAHWLAVAGIC